MIEHANNVNETLRKIVIALAVLALLAFVANLLVDNPYTHRLVRAAINEKVEDNTNLTVDFKAMKVTIVPPGAELYGFALAPKMSPDSPLISASHVRARVSVWSLILGNFRLALAETDDLTIIWPPPFGFPGFFKDDPEAGPPEPARPAWPPPFELPIDNIVLKNAKIYAEVPLTEAIPMAPSSFIGSAVGIDVDLDNGGWRDLRAKISVHSMNAALKASSLVEETSLEAIAVVAGDRTALPMLRIRGERLNFDGAVTANLKLIADELQKGQNLLDAIDIAATGDVEGDMSLLGSWLDLPDTRGPVSGSINLTAMAPIHSSAPATVVVEGQGKVKDAYLAGFHLHNSAAKFHITPELVEFPEIDVIIGERVVGKGSGRIKVGDVIGFDFKAAPDGLTLQELLEALGADFDLIDTTLQSPDLRLWGVSEPFVLNVSATAQFSELDTPTIVYDRARFPEKPACRLDFHLAVTSTNLDFGGTHGNCFQPRRAALPMPVAGSLAPPPGATAASRIAAAGEVFFDGTKGLRLDIRGEDVDVAVAQYFAQQPLQGTAVTKTLIHGPTSGPDGSHVLVDTEAHARELVVSGIPLGNLHGTARIDGEELTWRDVTSDLDGQGLLRSPSGKLGINDAYPIKAKLTARQLTPAMAHRIMSGATGEPHPFFAGVDKIDGDIEGPLFFPGAWRGKFEVGLYEGDYDGERLFDAARATIKSDAKGWSTDNIIVSLGALQVAAKVQHERAFPFSLGEAHGTDPWAAFGLHPDDKFSFEFNTLGDAAASGGKDHLGTLPFVGEKLKAAAIEGGIQLSGKVRGTPDNLQGTFSGSVQRPNILGSPLTPIELKGFVKNSALDIVLNHSGGALEGRMSIDVRKPKIPYEWYFNFNRMDLRAFGTQAFHKDPRNYLYLTAGWHMKGELTDWWRSVGELELKDIRAKYVQDIASQTKTLQVRQEQPVTLRFTGTEWRFDGDKDLYLSGRNLQLRLSMTGSRPPDNLGLHIESIIDMGLVREFSQDIDTASGKIRVIADATGPVSEPKLRVEVTDLKPNPWIAATWKAVGIGFADVRPEFKNIRMRVIYENQHLLIDSFHADKGTGQVSVTGGIDFTPGAPPEASRLDIAAEDATVIFPVAFLKSFEAQLTGNVSIIGSKPPFKLSGDVKVNRARSTKEVDIRNEVINALRSNSFKTSVKSEKPTFLLDLTVRADQTINIHNKNLQSVLSTDLSIKGTDLAPSISGQVEVDKGKFIYKRDFQIQRGLVTFDDPVKPDPSIDILAVSEVEAYRVYISVTGRASNPTVEFSIDPPTDEDGTPISKVGILVGLSRGKIPKEINGADQTRGTATSEALNLILGQYEEPVERLFDLSGQNIVRNVYLDVHPSSDVNENGAPVPRLNLPLDLGEDFDVVLRSDQSANEVAAEYDIHDNIRVSGTYERKRDEAQTTTSERTVNPASDTKFDLKFRFSFE